MGPKLQALLELQDIELQIVDIKRQLARKERAVTRQKKKVADLRAELATEKEALLQTQMTVDRADVELKARQGHIERMRNQLNTVRTNKEYAATLAELNNEKADVNKLEQEALEKMGELEANRQAFAERQQTEQHEIDRLADLEAQLEQSRQSFSDKLRQLAGLRQVAVGKLDDDEAVTLFDRLSERYDGEALAEIERTHPRRDEFICGGCYMSLSAETANAVLTRDDVTTCGNCGRIVWMMKGG